MSDIPVSKKLELIQQIRSRYQQDRYDMFHREKLLYGRTTPLPVDNGDMKEGTVGEYDEEEHFSTLPLRTLLAVGLFLLIIVCDMSGKSFMGIQPGQCFSAISADYESSIAKWVDAASNTSPPAGSRP